MCITLFYGAQVVEQNVCPAPKGFPISTFEFTIALFIDPRHSQGAKSLPGFVEAAQNLITANFRYVYEPFALDMAPVLTADQHSHRAHEHRRRRMRAHALRNSEVPGAYRCKPLGASAVASAGSSRWQHAACQSRRYGSVVSQYLIQIESRVCLQDFRSGSTLCVLQEADAGLSNR